MASHKPFQANEMPQILPKGHFLLDKEEEFKNGSKIEYRMHRMICEVASDTPFCITHGRKRSLLVESSKNFTAFMTLLLRLSSTQTSVFHFPDNQKLQE